MKGKIIGTWVLSELTVILLAFFLFGYSKGFWWFVAYWGVASAFVVSFRCILDEIMSNRFNKSKQIQ